MEVQEGTSESCHDIRDVLDLIGDKWTVSVVGCLSISAMRHTRLRKEIPGISQRMLTLTLRTLERDGLVCRSILDTAPPGVEYRLTRLGRTLVEPVMVITNWAKRHFPEIRQARDDFDNVQLNNQG